MRLGDGHARFNHVYVSNAACMRTCWRPMLLASRSAIAYALATVSDTLAWWGFSGDRPPRLTRYVVKSTCEDFSFTHARATRDFGYQPVVSFEPAQADTIEWLKQAGFAK